MSSISKSTLLKDITSLSQNLFSASTFISGGINSQNDLIFKFLQTHSLSSVLSFLRASCETHDEAQISSTTLVLDGIFSSREVMTEIGENKEASYQLIQSLCEATLVPQREVRLLAISLFKHIIRFDLSSGILSLFEICKNENEKNMSSMQIAMQIDNTIESNEQEQGQSLLHAIISRLADADVGVAESVEHTLFFLAEKVSTRNSLSSSSTSFSSISIPSDDECLSNVCKSIANFANSISALADVTGTINVRVCTFVSKVCGKLGENGFLACISTGLVSYFLNLFAASSDDMLLQMSLLELLPQLAHTRRGFAVLENTITRLLTLAGLSSSSLSLGSRKNEDHLDVDEDDNILTKDSFLGDVAYGALCEIVAKSSHNVVLINPIIKGGLERLKEGGEEEIVATLGSLSVALERNWANVTSLTVTQERNELLFFWGKQGLSRNENERVACFSSLAKIIRGSNMSYLFLILQDKVELYLQADTVETVDTAVDIDFSSPYKKQVEEAFEVLVKTLKDNSAPRARCAVYDLLSSIVEVGDKEGIKFVFKGHKSLLSLLFSMEGNDIERESKEGREWRYGIFLGALKNKHCKDSVNSDVFEKLIQMKEAGPHLPRRVTTEAAVMGPILRGSE
jgi:hypothetical protein